MSTPYRLLNIGLLTIEHISGVCGVVALLLSFRAPLFAASALTFLGQTLIIELARPKDGKAQ